jgi:hypothetical protein
MEEIVRRKWDGLFDWLDGINTTDVIALPMSLITFTQAEVLHLLSNPLLLYNWKSLFAPYRCYLITSYCTIGRACLLPIDAL